MSSRVIGWSAFTGLLSLIVPVVAAADGWNVQQRKRVGNRQDGFRIVQQDVQWNPRQTAIVVVDMWDNHHCRSAARRVAEMAPHMNKVLQAARRKGIFVIHAPSDCMDAYRDTAPRKRAQSAPFAESNVKFQWNYLNAEHEAPLHPTLGRLGCSCDSPEPCGPDDPNWTRQIAAIRIDDQDAVSARGQEVFNLLKERGIRNVVVMGVHTNACVLGRPFGIRQMVYVGQNVVLCRDLTDSYHRAPGRHFEALDSIIAHVEKYWCPTITSRSITGRSAFVFAGNNADSTPKGR